MRKRIIGSDPSPDPGPSREWIDLRHVATVEVTSEDPDFPIEAAFSGPGSGWRAAQPGEQTVRLIFDQPANLRRLQFHFIEREYKRTQEFAVRWSSADGGESKEIVRQQWNFSPEGSTQEIENYEVSLENVSALELVIKPDLQYDEARATLTSWRVA